MTENKYRIREICGDWALDIHWGKETIVLFFNSRNNAELVKAVLEWEDAHPNRAVPYSPTLTPPNEQATEAQTCALVEELKKRDGVEVHIAEPHEDLTVSINGPAVILVVTD